VTATRTAALIASAWRTPLGATVDAAMARLYAGERAAIADDRAAYAFETIAPLRDEPARSRNARFLRRMGLFALEVATEALAASGVGGGERVGLFSGVGGLRAHWDDMLAAFAPQRDDGERMWERGLRDVHPYWMLRHLSNNVHAIASAELDVRGEGATFGGGNAGAQALAAAIRALHDGAIDAALVVAHDSLLEPETLVELGARGWPAAGLVPGEAAAAVVLVREREGAPRLTAHDAAGPGAVDRLASMVGGHAVAAEDPHARDEAAVVDRVAHRELATAMGQVGAATAVVQAIALAEQLRARRLDTRAAIGLHESAPGLASLVHVEVLA